MSACVVLNHNKTKVNNYLLISVDEDSKNFQTSTQDNNIYYANPNHREWARINMNEDQKYKILGMANMLPLHIVRKITADSIVFDACRTLVIEILH